MIKMWFSSHLISAEITMREYKTLTSIECTTIIITVLMIMSGLGSSQDYMDVDGDIDG
jgi:hypothetical protein